MQNKLEPAGTDLAEVGGVFENLFPLAGRGVSTNHNTSQYETLLERS